MLAELAAGVRDGRIDPVDLVSECLRRVDKHNDEINAVVGLRAEAALADAKASRGRGPLAGIPFFVKDLEHAVGMRTSMGSRWHADDPVDTVDDVVVERLKAAGGIFVGKTNTPEFGWVSYTWNPLFGATKNPWNTEKAPGGSSGGSAAALIAGLAPMATSSDGGGSVRIPASICGLVGYKPTNGAIARNFLPNWIDFSTDGALGRSVADVCLEASITMGPAGNDMRSLPAGTIPLDPVLPGRVVACPTLRQAADQPVLDTVASACDLIGGELGLPLREVDHVFDVEPDVLTAWLFIAAAELRQGLDWAWDERKDELDVGCMLMATLGEYVSTMDYVKCQRLRFEAAGQLEDLLGDDGVLVTSTVNASPVWGPEGPLPTNTGGVDGSPAESVNTMDFNFTGHPAVSVPMGTGPDGVPIGVQIVAPRFRDDLALGLAARIEAVRPWPTVAAGFDPFPVP